MEMIECNYMFWFRVGVGRDTHTPSV